MRRPAVGSQEGRMQVHDLTKLDSKVQVFAQDANSPSPCWRCTSTPCIKVNSRNWSELDFPEFGSIDAEQSLCPTKAIKVNALGIPEVDGALCIGCGLCVSGCSIGALLLDKSTGTPAVNQMQSGKILTESEAAQQYLTTSQALTIAHPNAADLNRQLDFFIRNLSKTSPAAKRIFVRNALSALGAKVALRTQGSNSLGTELIAIEDGRHYFVEIEGGEDTLDPFRRLIASAARAIGRHQIEASNITLALVLPRLPNKRVDFYRLCDDARNYLNLNVVVIPFAALAAALLQRQKGLARIFGNFNVYEGKESLLAEATAVFGDGLDPSLGFEPSK